jgi:hypothetical protein
MPKRINRKDISADRSRITATTRKDDSNIIKILNPEERQQKQDGFQKQRRKQEQGGRCTSRKLTTGVSPATTWTSAIARTQERARTSEIVWTPTKAGLLSRQVNH